MSDAAQRYLQLRSTLGNTASADPEHARLQREINELVEAEEDLFEAVYEVALPLPDHDLLWQEAAATQPPERLWTVVEGDDGNLWVMAGWHHVNRMGHLVTTQPWAGDWESFLWLKNEDDEEDEDEDDV